MLRFRARPGARHGGGGHEGAGERWWMAGGAESPAGCDGRAGGGGGVGGRRSRSRWSWSSTAPGRSLRPTGPAVITPSTPRCIKLGHDVCRPAAARRLDHVPGDGSRAARRGPPDDGPAPGKFHFTSNGLTTADCTGTLPAAPDPPEPVAAAGQRHAHRAVDHVRGPEQPDRADHLPGTGPSGNSTDLSADAANLSGAFGPYAARRAERAHLTAARRAQERTVHPGGEQCRRLGSSCPARARISSGCRRANAR